MTGRFRSRNEPSTAALWKGCAMRAKVLPTKCETVGACVMICPDVFRFQPGSKKAAVIADPVPEIYENDCREAAESCPRNAIVIFED